MPCILTGAGVKPLLCTADGDSGSEEWGNADVLKLTGNSTGNNAFPAFAPDGSEVSIYCGAPIAISKLNLLCLLPCSVKLPGMSQKIACKEMWLLLPWPLNRGRLSSLGVCADGV